MRNTRGHWSGRGLVAGIVAVLIVLGAARASYAADPPLTLSASLGPSGGGNVVTVTASGFTFFPGVTVEFQYVGPDPAASCASTYATPEAVDFSGNPAVQTAGTIAVA